MLLSAIRRSNVHAKIYYLIPYMPYARQNNPWINESAWLKEMGHILSSLWLASIFVVHPHTDLQPYFTIPIVTIDCSPIIDNVISQYHKPDVLIVAPDQWATSFIKTFAHTYNYTNYISCHKYRIFDNQVDNISLDIKHQSAISNKICWIIDDMYDTGGTIYKVANTLHNHGARSIYARCTHWLCSNNWDINLDNSFVSTLYMTNSVNHCSHNKITTITIDTYIKNIATQYILSF